MKVRKMVRQKCYVSPQMVYENTTDMIEKYIEDCVLRAKEIAKHYQKPIIETFTYPKCAEQGVIIQGLTNWKDIVSLNDVAVFVCQITDELEEFEEI